ncbi:MAG: hypothetical protein AAFX65_10515, partial [Cyanobacteria bacterium J06638_7]
ELIAVARVDVEWFKVCRQIRDAIEAIPARVLDRICSEVGELNTEQKAVVRGVLEQEHRAALEALGGG